MVADCGEVGELECVFFTLLVSHVSVVDVGAFVVDIGAFFVFQASLALRADAKIVQIVRIELGLGRDWSPQVIGRD